MKRNILLILLAILPFFAFGYRDPETGTFLTRDPAGMADGPNLYTYVHQNPWTHFDPDGLFPDAQTTFHGLSEQQEIQVSKDVSIGAAASAPFAFVGAEGIGGMGIGWGGRMAYMGLQTGGAGVVGRSISDGLYGDSSTTQQLSGTGAFSAIAGVGLQAVGKALEPVLNKAASILGGEAKATTASINPSGQSASTLSNINSLELPAPQNIIPSKGVVYRGLSDEEFEEGYGDGMFARSPDAFNDEASHVAGKIESQWISTTKSLKVATEKYGDNGVVQIDLNKVKTPISDVSGGFPGKGMVNNFAKADQEVLIQKHIPPEAISPVTPPPSTK